MTTTIMCEEVRANINLTYLVLMVSKGYKKPQKANPAAPPAINVADSDVCNGTNAELNVSKADGGIEGTIYIPACQAWRAPYW